jgi:hypothetical protein
MTKKQLVARCLDCALVGSVFGMVAPSQSCRGGCPVLYFAAAAGHPQAEQALPALAMITVVMTIVAAVLRRGEGMRFNLLVAAVICFVVGGLITGALR